MMDLHWQALLKSLGDAGAVTWTSMRGGYYMPNTVSFAASIKEKSSFGGTCLCLQGGGGCRLLGWTAGAQG